MNGRQYRRRNALHKMKARLAHPWPLYVKVGGIEAVVNHADGSHTDLGKVATGYAKRWGVGSR